MTSVSRQVLCIDDDPQSLKVRKILLETRGYLVSTVTSGPEGLRAVRSRSFDAVVLDYHMPGMDGGEVAREMKKWDPAIPVIILSALPWLPDDAPSDCIDAFVSKNEPTAVLVNALEQAIAQSANGSGGTRGGWPDRLARRIGSAAGRIASTVEHVVHHRKPAQEDSKPITRSIVA